MTVSEIERKLALLQHDCQSLASLDGIEKGERRAIQAIVSQIANIRHELTAALSDQAGVEQFISDMADSVNEVVGTARQKEIFKASLRLAISHARRKAAHRVAAPPLSSTAGEG